MNRGRLHVFGEASEKLVVNPAATVLCGSSGDLVVRASQSLTGHAGGFFWAGERALTAATPMLFLGTNACFWNNACGLKDRSQNSHSTLFHSYGWQVKKHTRPLTCPNRSPVAAFILWRAFEARQRFTHGVPMDGEDLLRPQLDHSPLPVFPGCWEIHLNY